MKFKMILPYVLLASPFGMYAHFCGPKQNDTDTGFNNKKVQHTRTVRVISKENDNDTLKPVNQVVSVKTDNKDVIYTTRDGHIIRRTGGSRAWRNNNPGNLRYYEFSKRHGAIGLAGGFAIFPDEETGMRALRQLLETVTYQKMTLGAAIERYAVLDTKNYKNQIKKLTGLSEKTKMCDLSAQQLDTLAASIRKVEGWIPGTEQQSEIWVNPNTYLAFQNQKSRGAK